MTLTHEEYVSNVLSVFANASDASYEEGMHWYDEANALARELSPDNVLAGAGVLAAYSANASWKDKRGNEGRNIILARRAFATGIASGHTSTFNNKVQRILDGHNPLEVIQSNKQRAFMLAIHDFASANVAVIDRHAHDVAMGRFFADKDRKIGKRIFSAMSNAYVEAAGLAGISVAQIQAVTWVSWKKRRDNAGRR